MKTEKLEEVLKAMKELGHEDVEVFYENGKDGTSDLVPVVATLKQSGTTEDRSVSLVFHKKGR